MDKKFTDQWSDYIHEMKSLNKAADAAFELYIKKYAKEDSVKYPRKEKISEKFFTPGKIYSFLYATQDKPNKDRPVIDRRPIVLSLGQLLSPANNKIYEIGIDFMLVPPKVRIFMLDQLFKFYKKDINENQKELNEGRKGKKALRLNYEISKKLFDKLGWQMAFSAFEKGNVAQAAVYDYEDWVSVIPLYTRGMTGKQPKEIYETYIKKMTTAPDVDLNERLKTASDKKKDEIKKKQKEFKDS